MIRKDKQVYSVCGQLSYIERRPVTAEDLASDTTWVVDTGERWEPELKNFDHHQDAVEGQCAFDLVLREVLGQEVYDSYQASQPWIRATALHDTLGAIGAANAMGVGLRTYLAARSPIERCMLAAFSEMVVVHPESPLAICMRETGRIIVGEAESTSAGTSVLASAADPFDRFGIRVWDIRGVANAGNEQVSLLVLNQEASSKGVDLIVSHNSRTGGFGLYRTAWASKKLDLSTLAGKPGVKFAHTNGFYAVLFGETTDAEIADLVRQSVTPEAG